MSKKLIAPLLGTLIAVVPLEATAADAPRKIDACELMPKTRVAKRAKVKIANVKGYDFMDAMQIYRCDYYLEKGAGIINLIIMDYTQLNPDPSMRPGGPTVAPASCYSFAVKGAATRMCSLSEPAVTISFGGPAKLLQEKAALKLVDEANASWAKK